MYFYPDRILSSLRQIIENDGFGYEDAINDAIPFMPDAMEAQKAIDFVSTGSVQSNLSISLKDLDELRAVADFKTGVRSLLHSIFLIAAIKRDRQLILKLAKEAYEDITYLNKQIEQLERSLNT
ncbi:MAG: hypothetical protein DI537_25370 [Stutzerimonas stutzeri]|nr:MAG: hypothetical protein DI537_25370 [Stutzerimonas stutzeri]